jgi:hypothetical protein
MPLTLKQLNEGVYCVMDHHGLHVGNLKRINGLWKFKAIGYDTNGDIMPGWGPLTERHNTTFDTPNEDLINRKLLSE